MTNVFRFLWLTLLAFLALSLAIAPAIGLGLWGMWLGGYVIDWPAVYQFGGWGLAIVYLVSVIAAADEGRRRYWW